MVETSAIAKTGTSMGKNWNLKPLQSEKLEPQFKVGRVDLACGVCINNEEWLKPLQSEKTGTSMGNELGGRDLVCGSLYVTTRNGETSAIKNWNLIFK
ncbi:hypothetical protein CEXT_546951 [Caerostris extrusa]|uniref:Uncharacterized protein n=1 Tax=Caerostris extrusa TaxID=172846 RepID=A0AAV4VGZ3_CAEEX|nr:hypothetical protein CEXT_546951 [Caerostris extrusa]